MEEYVPLNFFNTIKYQLRINGDKIVDSRDRLLISKHIAAVATKTHDGTLTELGKHFVLTGQLDRKYGRFYARMIQLRIKADYNSIAEVSEQEVNEMAPLTHEFIEALLPLLAK